MNHIVAGGLAVSGVLLAGWVADPQAAQASAADRCDPRGPISGAYYDPVNRSLSGHATSVSFEKASGGLSRRTIYLEQGGYAVSVCQPSGMVHEELYHQLSKSTKPRVVFVMDLKPRGEATGVHVDYGEPPEKSAAPAGKDRLTARSTSAKGTPLSPTRARALARKTTTSQAVRAIRSWSLPPGDRSRMTRFKSTRQVTTKDATARAAYLGNKCYHDSRIWLQALRPSRTLGYYSALGSINSPLVYAGARAFPDVWNFCGWSVGSGLNALNAGDIGSFTLNVNDGVDQIGWSVASGGTCGGVSSLACNYTRWQWDASLNAYRILENDIALNPNEPWANGAVIGRYDLQSVVAHEVGHSWGFGDIPPSVDPYAADQVMYGVGQLYQDHERYLGYGDYQLMRIVYP